MPKISQLEAATDITASDLMQVVDIEDTGMAPSGTNKKITAQLLADDLAGIVTDNAISGAKITDGTITSAKIANGSIVNADINASAAIDGSKISPSFTTNSSVTVDSSSTALAITQSGAGASLSVNGSYSSFLNDGGSVNLLISTAADSNQPSYLQYRKYRGTHALPTAVQEGDSLGSNAYYGYDGDSLNTTAFQNVAVDGPVSNGIIPTRFTFSTQNTSGVTSERMRITSAGNVGVGTTNPTAKLTVVDSTSIDALRITQTGSGNALVVEDSTNPDATPLVVDSSGRVLNGTTTPIVVEHINGGDAEPSYQQFSTGQGVASLISISTGVGFSQASSLSIARARGTIGSPTIVENGDLLGGITFQGYDGVDFETGARIKAAIDGTPGTDDLPTCLIFETSLDGSASLTERMRIANSGNVGIGTNSPTSKLHVAGDLTMSSATTATSATAGSNGDVPAQVAGYLVVNINGTARKIPYYA